MSESRADRMHRILSEAPDRRLSVAECRDKLAEEEGSSELSTTIVSATARQDNNLRRISGKSIRFNVYNDGSEQRGYISITKEIEISNTIKTFAKNNIDQLPTIIQQANNEVRKKLKEQISNLSWQEFEDNFLTKILESLGFSDIVVTQRTRDGGADAICTYKRGIVSSEAIVSAKHWKTSAVPDSEVDRLRGITHLADTAIIVTSSRFSKPATEKAKPYGGWRSVVLVDGDLIVETCLKNKIGVITVDLPFLYMNTDLRQDLQLGELTGD